MQLSGLLGSKSLIESCAFSHKLIYRLQRTEACSITLQHTASNSSRCIILQQTASHCITLHHTTTHCITLHHTATQCITLQHNATHCITLHHTASHGMVVSKSRLSVVVSQIHIAGYHTFTHTRTQTFIHKRNKMDVLEGCFSCVV